MTDVPAKTSQPRRRERSGDYAELRRRVAEAGLLHRSPGNYVGYVALIAIWLALTAALLLGAPGPLRLLAVFPLAMFWMQIGFIGHDAGHQQIFDRSRLNEMAGLLTMPLALGLSFASWVQSHNEHHGHTNEVGVDPNIMHPILAFTPEDAAKRRGLARWIVRHQAQLYFVLALGATVEYRLDAWKTAFRDRRGKTGRTELLLLAVNLAGYAVLPSLLLGPALWLPVFGIAQLLLGAYMAGAFAPNHKGMPVINAGERPTFFVQQLVTSRNVGGGPVVDYLYGGLNFQIEHHLFPALPRPNLRACAQIVRAYCAEVGLSYHEEDVVGAYKSLLGGLHAVGNRAAA